MRLMMQLIALAMLAFGGGFVFAEEEVSGVEVAAQPAGTSEATQPSSGKKKIPDIRTIIDMSGSMKKTDPNNLRAPAMRLLVDLLPEDSKSGVWTFGQYVNMLVKHRVIDDKWKEEAKSKSNDISSVGLFTNIGTALDTAGYDLDRLKPEYEPFFILLTDGMVDVDKDPEVNKKEQERIIKELVPKFAEAGVKLHTIALSDKADQDFLQQLSLSTGGKSTVAESSDELLKAFVRLFDQSVPAEQVPLTDNKFLIDSSIEEFTALIFRKEGSQATQLVSPDESIINADSDDPDVTWHADANYDLITIKRPYEGEWMLQAEADPDNRVTVVSDLSLQLAELPPTIFSGEEINVHAWFDSADGQVKEMDFLSLLDGQLRLTNEAGKSIQKEIELQTEGEYPHSYYEKIRNLRRPGNFEISVVVDGKTFQRERTHRIEVLEPFAYDVSYDGVGDESVGIVSATPLLSGLDLEKTSVIAKVRAPDDSNLIASAELVLSQDGQKWVVQVVPTKGQGTYLVSLDMKLVLDTGKEFRLKPKPFEVVLPHFPEGYIAPEPEVKEDEFIKPTIKEQEMSAPTDDATQPDQVPEQEPEAEPEEDNLFTWIMLGVLGLVAAILGFLFYKLRSHKKMQEEFNKEQDSADDGDDMGELSELGSDELNMDVDESPELSEQVDAVKDELERMGEVPEDALNEGVSEDSVPELEQDELVSALDELSGNEMDLDADDMMDDMDEDSASEAGAFDDPELTASEEEDLNNELDALLEDAEDAEIPPEVDIPTLDESVAEDQLVDDEEDAGLSQEPEIEVEFDEILPDSSDEDLTDDMDALTEDENSSLDELLEEDSETPVEPPVLEETSTTETTLESDDLELDDFEDVESENDTEDLMDEDDDFGSSIDQALDDLLAEADDGPQTTEEFDIDDLDAELDALTKDLEDDAFGGSDDLDDIVSGSGDDLESLLDSATSDDDLDGDSSDDLNLDELEKAFEETLGDDEPALEDSLTALEDISADELTSDGDDSVDVDKIMAEIDAEAMRMNKEDKD
ncbi:VWA domain-containing protein [Litoribacillus peritrichatus]|uniref:VWFA domain-containing protein n=1 Tax=Litoribacillus peritrichatus TaxID=718191 RepID=A0ABP7N717_9GAMM